MELIRRLNEGLIEPQRFAQRIARQWRDARRCWVWTGERQNKPRHLAYGLARLTDGRRVVAHRVAWQLAGFDIPPGLELDHKCHNPLCVRPSHMRLASRSEQNFDVWRPDGRRRQQLARKQARAEQAKETGC